MSINLVELSLIQFLIMIKPEKTEKSWLASLTASGGGGGVL